jgi:TPR repeat protein
MYGKGQGVAQDYTEAARWYRLAAAQGNANAQYGLGIMYAKGLGVDQDDTEAVKWHRLAAAQGHAKAQYGLGIMYRDGKGVSQDDAHAHMWFDLGAASGYADALKNRDIIATTMTTKQIEQAQKMALDCQKSKYTGCD